MAPSSTFVPMRTAGTQHLIERTYREGGDLQWVRETYTNAREAGAKRIEFGVEWQAVESLNVYRRTVSDDGAGMTPEQLVEFFNTYGGGGKPIGGAHENFGVGAKTSLLPWNQYGVVVISWVGGVASMIWVYRDPISSEYGLKLERAEDPGTGEFSLDAVYGAYDDPAHGCDWASVKPEWITDNGTVLILLGNTPHDDTVFGDPNRNESDIKGISSYLNRRIWEIPDDVSVRVDELRSQDRSAWPRSLAEAHGPQRKVGTDVRTNQRTIQGAKHFITYPVAGFTGGRLKVNGTVPLVDGTEIDWYLWEGDRPAVQSYASLPGYVAALYANELYDVTSHPSTLRSFGVAEGAVRTKLWLIIRPELLGAEGKRGVYPRTDRNALLLRGGPQAGGPLPLNDWAGQFADRMPQPIIDAMKRARGAAEGGTIENEKWRQRLADRFGSRWRITKLRTALSGPEGVTPSQSGGQPRVVLARKVLAHGAIPGTTGGLQGPARLGVHPGTIPATTVKVGGGIPDWRPATDGEVASNMLAAYQAIDPVRKCPMVLINVHHPVLRKEIEHWQEQFADQHAEQVEREVIEVYGQIAVAKVAHSEHLKSIIPSAVIDRDFRSEESLTMALLGLMAEEAVIAPRLGGKLRKRHTAA